MKIAGIVGGIGPESTIDYYRSIIASYVEKSPDGHYPALLINSLDLRAFLALFESDQRAQAAKLLSEAVERLAGAGASFGVLSANTPHLVFDEVSRSSRIPLISIVEVTCDAAESLGLKRVGLMGTRFTMQGGFYEATFSRRGISVVTPEPEDQVVIHEKYMTELVKGVFLPSTRGRLLTCISRMKERQQIQGLILGGTELPLILRDGPDLGIPFLDTTRIHVERIVAELLS